MAKIELNRSGNEGRHTLCAVIRIKLNDDDIEKIMRGSLIIEDLKNENTDLKFIIKKRKEGEE